MPIRISNTYYYSFKPFIPRRMQIYLRRFIAEQKQGNIMHIWPIDANAGARPADWPGWPEEKKFAFVLTHDVEKASGIKKCLPLLELEKTLGFISSFNFVPHGYAVPSDLWEKIRKEGFEIGVHGLTHDGNMFDDRAAFDRQAVQINKYLKEWDAHGFRAPSMYHNLDWILELDIQYDSSTFDTDPFEPQPDGVGTIYPFFVNGNDSRPGYVELPYTLPQDFTLFIMLQHNHIDVWKKKLDWIVERGGMALLNTHPDYMNFGDTRIFFEEYPVRFYTEFLNYVKNRYGGQYWHALPHEVARFFRKNMPAANRGSRFE